MTHSNFCLLRSDCSGDEYSKDIHGDIIRMMLLIYLFTEHNGRISACKVPQSRYY